MEIRAVRMGVVKAPLKVPFKTAVRTVDYMEDVVFCLEADNGQKGWGSAPPTGKVTGDTVGSIVAAAQEFLIPALLGRDGSDLNGCLDAVENALAGNSSAKAAFDIALHDLWANHLGQPLWRLWGGNGTPVKTDVTISVNEPEEMVDDALRAQADGFDVIKTKVGVDAEKDFKRLQAIREALGASMKIRIDANQGWAPQEAVRLLERMESAGFGIELVEQPVKARDIEGLAFVTAHSPVPVVADESCWSPRDALELLVSKGAHMVNIKLMKCGGLRAARRIIALTETMGVEVMMGCMLEGAISCSAAVHLTSASPCVTRVDIDGPVLCADDPVIGGTRFTGGPLIELTEAPGLGIEDVKNVAWL